MYTVQRFPNVCRGNHPIRKASSNAGVWWNASSDAGSSVSAVAFQGIFPGGLLPELLGEPDENAFGTPDVAESIQVLVLNYLAHELRAASAEPEEHIVDVLHGEHDAQVPEGVHWGAAVIGDHGRREEA
jgi:hypothetical protein